MLTPGENVKRHATGRSSLQRWRSTTGSCGMQRADADRRLLEENMSRLLKSFTTVLETDSMSPPAGLAVDDRTGASLLWAIASGLERLPVDGKEKRAAFDVSGPVGTAAEPLCRITRQKPLEQTNC